MEGNPSRSRRRVRMEEDELPGNGSSPQEGGGASGSSRPEGSRGRRVRQNITWDEGNLELNEQVKKALNPRKVGEPKTPYRPPLNDSSDTDEEEELNRQVSPGTLEEGLRQCLQRHPNGSLDSRTSNSLTQGDSHLLEERPVASWTGSTDEEELSHSMPAHANGHSNGSSHHDEFEQHRKEHYKMREALQRGKELAEKELQEVEDTAIS